jgi:hypothetical protein
MAGSKMAKQTKEEGFETASTNWSDPKPMSGTKVSR